MEWHLIILLAALVADWWFGEPAMLWSRIPHPVAVFGRLVGFVDHNLNRKALSAQEKRKRGGIAIALLIAVAIVLANLVGWLIGWFSPLDPVAEAFVVFVFIAQKSLGDHVAAVAVGLKDGGLQGGRAAVARIVGRDPQTLDESGVSRAAIESLAENFSDGVVAPAFWYVIFGLPGLFAYKMINTADSMIAHKSEKYLDFGRYAALVDDLANWIPARISVLLIAFGALLAGSSARAKSAITVALRDASMHASPNSGWPEAAMAGASGIALGGPRNYAGRVEPQQYINATGKMVLDDGDIDRALDIFARACFTLWGVVVAGILLV